MATIGLLEDNARIARMCTTFLHFVGHDVTVYEHPRKCLQALLSHAISAYPHNLPQTTTLNACTLPIELLILDISLPDIDGVEVMWQLQSQPQTQRLPLILCTAAPHSEIARALHIAPHASLVTKPFKLETLISAISNALAPVVQ